MNGEAFAKYGEILIFHTLALWIPTSSTKEKKLKSLYDEDKIQFTEYIFLLLPLKITSVVYTDL